jgi:hypothetical protein
MPAAAGTGWSTGSCTCPARGPASPTAAAPPASPTRSALRPSRPWRGRCWPGRWTPASRSPASSARRPSVTCPWWVRLPAFQSHGATGPMPRASISLAKSAALESSPASSAAMATSGRSAARRSCRHTLGCRRAWRRSAASNAASAARVCRARRAGSVVVCIARAWRKARPRRVGTSHTSAAKTPITTQATRVHQGGVGSCSTRCPPMPSRQAPGLAATTFQGSQPVSGSKVPRSGLEEKPPAGAAACTPSPSTHALPCSFPGEPIAPACLGVGLSC